MKRLILAAALAASFSAPSVHAAERLAVTVEHDLAIARPSETISIPWRQEMWCKVNLGRLYEVVNPTPPQKSCYGCYACYANQ